MEALEEALAALPEEERGSLPRLVLGAEVAWVPNLLDCSNLRDLCYAGTDALLLELPITPWSDGLFSQIMDLMNATGLIPVIAHIDRYWGSQRPERLKELLGLGLPTQLSAEMLLHFAGRGKALRELQAGKAQLLMSDCHDLKSRKPNLGEGMAVVEKKLGQRLRRKLEENTDSLLRDFAREGVR